MKVDLKQMEKMLRSGVKNKDVAKHFGVTPGCISQHSKHLKHLVVRSATLERADEVVRTQIDVVEQLNRINYLINDEMEIARKNADDADGDDRIKHQRVIIDLSAELRKQMDAQIKIMQLWHDASIVAEFQNEVLDVLDKALPGKRDEIIFGLKQAKAVRSLTDFS